MWPTFYIPGFNLTPGIVTGELNYVCGVDACPFSVPRPTGIRDGDIQVVFVSPQGSATGWPDLATDGWREIFLGGSFVGGQTTFGRGLQRCFWRIWTTGAADFLAPAAADEVCWVSCTLGNTNYSDPFYSAWLSLRNSSPYGSAPLFPANYIEPSASGDVILQFTSDTRDHENSAEPDNDYIEFACRHYGTNPLNTYEGHVVSALYAEKGSASNLLRYSNDLTQPAWTKVNCTVANDVPIGSLMLSPTFMQPTTANGYHYIEQEVTLEAGKYYTFAGRVGRLNSGAPTIWFTYVKPDATEHGCGFINAFNVYNMTGSTEVVWGGPTSTGGPALMDGAQDILPIFTHFTLSYPFYCDQSGTYKFRVHSRSGGGTQPYTTETGNTNRYIAISDLVVQESPSNNSQPSFLATGASAILVGQSNYCRLAPPAVQSRSSDASRGYGGIIVRRGRSGPRPYTTLFNPAVRGTTLDFDDYTINDTRNIGQPVEDGSPVTTYTSAVVYEYLSQKKFYFEKYVDSYGTGSTSDYYSIGFCPFERNITSPRQVLGPNSTAAFGPRDSQYCYMATGKVYADGVLDGTYTAWSVGDYIGAAIDFTNWEISFYRNGTLIRTVSIANDRDREHLWVGVCAWYHNSTMFNQARFTYNFRGPFGGRKPSGFVAFDFDNEVT